MLLSMIPLFYVNCGLYNYQAGFEQDLSANDIPILKFLKTDMNQDNIVDAKDMEIFNATFVFNDLTGDFNLDGVVDSQDLDIIKQDYCKFENLDINADGLIDFYDLEIVQNYTNLNYNNCYDVNKDGVVDDVDIDFYLRIGVDIL